MLFNFMRHSEKFNVNPSAFLDNPPLILPLLLKGMHPSLTLTLTLTLAFILFLPLNHNLTHFFSGSYQG